MNLAPTRYRVRRVRVYAATRKTTSSVARERTTPRVIEPATNAIVTIAH